MKYSVVNVRCSTPRVLCTFPFHWMANAVAGARGGAGSGIEVAGIPTDAQEIINICVHRDQVIEMRDALERQVDDMTAGKIVLWGLVARGDKGEWVTVHDADHPLDEHGQAVLQRLFGES